MLTQYSTGLGGPVCRWPLAISAMNIGCLVTFTENVIMLEPSYIHSCAIKIRCDGMNIPNTQKGL